MKLVMNREVRKTFLLQLIKLKNKNLYFLIPLVLIIWGVLVYKFFDSLGGNNNSHLNENIITSAKSGKVHNEIEDIKLQELKSDPFLNINYKKNGGDRKESIPSIRKEKVEWPKIRYLGSIKGQDNKRSIYIITVNGQQILLERGDNHQGIKFIKSAENKLWLAYKGETKFYIKT